MALGNETQRPRELLHDLVGRVLAVVVAAVWVVDRVERSTLF